MKTLIPLSFFLALLLACTTLLAQDSCELGLKHNSRMHVGWTSCEHSNNPNTQRPMSHWIQYDLGQAYKLGSSRVWNYNETGATDKGFRDVYIDYSIDGTNWIFHSEYYFPKAPGQDGYEGFAGPDFQGLEARYILITAKNTWPGSSCAGLAEIAFKTAELEESNCDSAENSDCWNLVWCDDFEGNSLNSGNWSIRFNGHGNVFHNEATMQCFTNEPDNVYVGNGFLHMIAQREDRVCEYKYNNTYRNYKYTGSTLDSDQKFTQKYGRFEARMKVPTADGVWPAFWMSPSNGPGWPTGGEIDIMEFWGSDNDYYNNAIFYGPCDSDGDGDLENCKIDQPKFYYPSGTGPDQFHLYALEWEPGELRFYFDDTLVRTLNPDDLVDPALWPFDSYEFYIRFTMLVSSDSYAYAEPPANDGAAYPQEMLIDYVRVYNKNPNCEQQNDDQACALISNGKFEQGTTDWSLYRRAGVSAALTIDNAGPHAELAIADAGSSYWHLSLQQSGVELEAGKTYLVKFAAKAETNRQMRVYITNQNGSQYHYYAQAIGTSWNGYEYQFTMNEASDMNSKVSFGFGKEEADVYIDNISIAELDCGSEPEAAADCDLISNSSFQNGNESWTQYSNAAATANFEYTNEQATIDISNGGTRVWHVQLYQKFQDFDANSRYVVSFKARSNAARTITLELSEATSPHTGYFYEDFELSSNWEQKYLVFETSNAISDARLVFNAGLSNRNVYLDDIEIRKEECLTTCNLIANSHFDQQNQSWTQYANSGANAQFDYSQYSGEIEITNGGTKVWHVQLYQQNLPIVAGQSYTLSFKAKAQSARNITIDLSSATQPHQGYFYKTLPIKEQWETYNISINPSTSDPTARLVFNLGLHWADVDLDDVMLIRNDCSEELLLDKRPGLETAKAIISPNPFSDYINIDLSLLERTECELFLHSINGKLVRQTKGDGNKSLQFYTEDLPAGIYILSVQGKQELSSYKIIKH